MEERMMEQATKAAEWWAAKIAGKDRHDNGDRTGGSIMACLMADMMRKPVTEDQLETFKTTLVEIIQREMEKNILPFMHLCCDYGPDLYLREAAKNADIPVMNFPFKTNMVLCEDGDVRVSDGYAKPSVSLMEKEG